MAHSDWTVPELTDDEIMAIIRNIDYDVLLLPIKKENNKYQKYRRSLGNLNKKSILVQKNLPGCILKLYKSRDPVYVKIIEENIRKLQECLVPFMEKAVGKDLTSQEIQELTAEELADILKKHEDSGGGNSIDPDLLQVQLKMNGFSLSEEDKKTIVRILSGNTEEEADINDAAAITSTDSEAMSEKTESAVVDEIISDTQATEHVVEKEKRKKAKKPTAEEKAEKNRLALERKQAMQVEIEKITEPEIVNESETDDSDKSIDDKDLSEMQSSDISKEEKTMTTTIKTDSNNYEEEPIDGKHAFVGYIDIRSYSYYNFQPIGLLKNGRFVFKKRSELDELLPESVYGNINLRYDFNMKQDYIDSMLHQGQLMILEVSLDDLQDNISSSGERNKTGYYITCRQAFARHQLRYLYEDGLYRCITPSLTLDEIASKKTAFISRDLDFELTDGEKILLRMDGVVLGPIEVKVSDQVVDKYIINPGISEHQYLTEAYNNDDIIKETIQEDPERDYGDPVYEYYFRIKSDAAPETLDLIPDSVLMDSLQDFIHEHSLTEAPDASALEESDMKVLKGKYVTEDILHNRVSRILQLLNDKEKVKEYSS